MPVLRWTTAIVLRTAFKSIQVLIDRYVFNWQVFKMEYIQFSSFRHFISKGNKTVSSQQVYDLVRC